jgi:hypothetical protein
MPLRAEVIEPFTKFLAEAYKGKLNHFKGILNNIEGIFRYLCLSVILAHFRQDFRILWFKA